MTTTNVSKRRSTRKTYEDPATALQRIQSMQMGENDVLVIHAFADAGVPPEDIDPRRNVLTFNAWKALDRRVAKGATSIRVCVWIPATGKAKAEPPAKSSSEKPKAKMRPVTARLFHVSQTVPADAPKGTRPEAWQNPALVKAATYDAESKTVDVEHTTENPADLA